jgi:hypothetical protein
MSVSGTSFSSPIVAGVFAAVKSFPGNQNLTMRQTVDVVNSYLNDGGAAGKDPALGAGMPDLARVIQGKLRESMMRRWLPSGNSRRVPNIPTGRLKCWFRIAGPSGW